MMIVSNFGQITGPVLRNPILCLLWITCGILLSCSCNRSGRQEPNIILILADDLGYGELGCYGQEMIETPHIDALADGGMLFTQHYSGSPVCAPSRCVLLTGRHSGHAYIRGNDEWRERGPVWDYLEMIRDPGLEGQRPLPEGTLTIGTLLQEIGYRTAIVGKWGLGAPQTEGIPNRQGFDLFYGYNCQRQAHTYNPVHLWRNGEKVLTGNDTVAPGTGLPEGADPLDPESYADFWLDTYSPDLMFREIRRFVAESRDQPFFLYWATPIPHVPLQAPPRWVRHYTEKFGEEPPYTGDRGYFPHRYPRAAYAGMISYLDQQVGQLVEQLKSLGIYENTLIIFTSDNGPSYAGGTDSPWFNSAGIFREEYGFTKGFLHEGGIRVPMIAHWPGHIAPGSRTGHLSAFWDLLPTLCEVAGAEIPPETDGISFLPTLLEEKDQMEHDFLYWEFPSYGGQQAVRMGPWKGFRKNILEGNLELELYHLKEDPAEERNVASDHPDITEKLEKLMKESHTPAAIPRFRMEALGDPSARQDQVFIE